MSTVLIVGRREDPHTESVRREIEQLGCNVACFDSTAKDGICLEISNGRFASELNCKDDLNAIDARQISAVWLRQKPIVPLPWWSPLQHDAARFIQNEWRNVIQSLEVFVPCSRWMNRPEAQRRINYKPAQLVLAQRVGFAIPETTITNNPDVVAEMIGKYGRLIYKNLSGYIFTDQTGILTSLVTSEHVRQDSMSIRQAPGVYQRFVEKAFEVRATAVGDRVFAARIETPKDGPAAVDWRHAQFEDIFWPLNLPAKIEAMIQRYLAGAEICFGAFDFIVTPKDEWVFLECNPAGQFLWLENALGQPISRSIAEFLTENVCDRV